MQANSNSFIDLGFAELASSWRLTNRYFPSKIGGKVAWLELENIPDAHYLKCEYCCLPCLFLCQIYAPSSEANINGFHRTIFVFICRNAKCCSTNQSGNIKILRSQLPLKNKFYSDSPPDESYRQDAIDPIDKVCIVCSLKAPMVCGRCKKINYCCQAHQKIDWRNHKKYCNAIDAKTLETSDDLLFPEFEIIIEREEINNDVPQEEKEETKRMLEYEEMIKEERFSWQNDFDEQDLLPFAHSEEDKFFETFKKLTDLYKDQIIRYSRHGKPLWISSYGVLSTNVPNCLNCNGKRSFEFQIMPQMLNLLKNYDLDWGIIAVFTCEKDCDTNGKYMQEFCYKQDLVNQISIEDISKDIEKVKIVEKSKDTKTEPSPNDSIKGSQKQKFSKNKINENNLKMKSFYESNNWE